MLYNLSRPDTSQRQRRWLPPLPLVIALVPLKCSSRILQFPHRVPFDKEKWPWCPWPFQKRSVQPWFKSTGSMDMRMNGCILALLGMHNSHGIVGNVCHTVTKLPMHITKFGFKLQIGSGLIFLENLRHGAWSWLTETSVLVSCVAYRLFSGNYILLYFQAWDEYFSGKAWMLLEVVFVQQGVFVQNVHRFPLNLHS